MWEMDHKEGWVLKNWCFWAVVWEKTLESLLDCKDIKPVNPKGDQSWVFIRRTDAEVETPVLWLPDVKSWLIRKDPNAGKDWGQEKGTTKDEMVEWHHRLNGHEFKQILGDREDREAWRAATHGVTKSRTRLSHWTVVKIHLPAQKMQARPLDREDPLEKEMETHSSILVWGIPWTEEPGGLHTVHGGTNSQTQLSSWAHTQERPQRALVPLPRLEDTARRQMFISLWSRKWAVTSHWICQNLDHRLASLQNCKKWMFVVYKHLLEQPEWRHLPSGFF